MKKGDLSINLIIIAVIALFILVIILSVFAGRFNIFSKTTNDCYTINGAKCTSGGCDEFTDGTYARDFSHFCYEGGERLEGYACCIPVER